MSLLVLECTHFGTNGHSSYYYLSSTVVIAKDQIPLDIDKEAGKEVLNIPSSLMEYKTNLGSYLVAILIYLKSISVLL
jgi:hypothetical protein